MRGICWVAVFWLANVTAGQAQVRHEVPAPTIELGADVLRLPMGSRGGRVLVEAQVEGKGPFTFYFDTGASGPVISRDLADQLKLPVLGEAFVKSGGDSATKKPIPGRIVRIDHLHLGTGKLSNVHVVAMDRSRLGGKDAPVGVLSPAMFAGYLVAFDYPKKEFRISRGELGSPDDKTIFAYAGGEPIPSVEARIGDQKIVAHLDSGSGDGLSLPTKIAEKLPLAGKPVDTGKRARSVSGDFPVFEGKLKGKLLFGQFSFEDPTISFSDVVRTGNLGARILERFVLTIDVKNRRFQMLEGK